MAMRAGMAMGQSKIVHILLKSNDIVHGLFMFTRFINVRGARHSRGRLFRLLQPTCHEPRGPCHVRSGALYTRLQLHCVLDFAACCGHFEKDKTRTRHHQNQNGRQTRTAAERSSTHVSCIMLPQWRTTWASIAGAPPVLQ